MKLTPGTWQVVIRTGAERPEVGDKILAISEPFNVQPNEGKE